MDAVNVMVACFAGVRFRTGSPVSTVNTCHTRVNMLTRVWQELEYRIDVCRFTRGAHMEHL